MRTNGLFSRRARTIAAAGLAALAQLCLGASCSRRDPQGAAKEVELLNVSENATFLVSDPDGGTSVLRVHRLGYHTEQEIASELAWMDALRTEAGVRTPRVLPAPGGGRVMTMADETGQQRHCVRFEYLPGTEPAVYVTQKLARGERMFCLPGCTEATAVWASP